MVRKTALAMATAGLLIVAGAPLQAQVVLAPQQFPVPSAADRLLLKDAIDIHAHLDPDSFGAHSAQAARSLDSIDMAKRAKTAGMRGFVIKHHYDETAGIAYLTSKQVPDVQAFGQLGLNLTVGGLNPAAVYHFAEIKGGLGRIVAMPTWDSENNIKHSQNPNKPFVEVTRDGALLAEARAVIAAVAAARVRDSGARLALSTGHLSPVEALMVIREAKQQGVEQIVVTHAMGHPVNMSVDQMKEAAGLGAFVEFAAGFVVGSRAEFSMQQYHDAIRAVGLDHVILSSDSGQMNRPMPDDMMAYVAGQLRAKGMTTAELRKIMVENPARLLGITQPPVS
jgi:Tat protein secretion system quality control protein TatD with DNase activity